MSLSHKRVAFAIVATALLAIAAAPRTLPAQDIEKNETGMLAYPNNIRTGIMYQAKGGDGRPAAPMIEGKHYQMYVATTKDAMPTVVAWYKSKFPSAKITTEGGRFPSATFFIENNIVEVSTFGGDTHVELKKYVPGA